MFSAFSFIDAGQVSENELSFTDYKFATGLGIRLKITRGLPVTFGYGYPLNEASQSEVKKFFVNLSYDF